MNPAISAYMRALQKKSTAAKWRRLSPDERRQKMSDLAKARWANRHPNPKSKIRNPKPTG